ncbi:hypothetical protein ACHAW6_002161 [Cyclotella cf. meneghiniana]
MHYSQQMHLLPIQTIANGSMCACIVQEGQPVAYFSYELFKSQQNYTVMEKEMLSIVATLNEF